MKIALNEVGKETRASAISAAAGLPAYCDSESIREALQNSGGVERNRFGDDANYCNAPADLDFRVRFGAKRWTG